MPKVYLLHFSEPLMRKVGPVQHYIGTAHRLRPRIIAHATGRGARITQVLRERGIGFIVARVWNGGRALEKKLKGRKKAHVLCPICQGTHPLLQAITRPILDDSHIVEVA